MKSAIKSCRIVVVLFGLLFIGGLARAQENLAAGSFAELYGKEYVIRYSPGGNVDDALWAAADIIFTGKQVKIDGPCYSSCTVFADKARKYVCITPRAVFGFHLGIHTEVIFKKEKASPAYDRATFKITRHSLPVSPDLEEWIAKHGGWTEGLLFMNATEASKFWPMCK